MPELPEVETVLRGLRKSCLGQRITQVEVDHPGVIVGKPETFAAGIEGRQIAAVSRKGKVLVAELAGRDSAAPAYLVMRLGMTGQVTVEACATPVEPHTHVRMQFEGGEKELRFRDVRRFGRLRCLTREELETLLASLGPDACQVTEKEFLLAMRARRGAVKSWLMNQQMLAGLGNIYADEALFEAHIHPLAQPDRISPAAGRRLYKAVQKVLKKAIELQGTSFRDYVDIEGRPGNYLPKLRVYQKTGEPCPRCRSSIRRMIIAGRSSHFCPRCQRRPRQVAEMRGPRDLQAKP
ncbi:MAG TPA: bifunctional DNA-formamidopyrimidine glycosylase/DNA-(apurinic or apyrimidinic site) lyase [Terriglobia bacterium]|nr:bifunctional DNA-formamidopyrimidine glycosylase/DNA-(apurinic or apyrimidinic site) lyase [Terriglobia bacterium]